MRIVVAAVGRLKRGPEVELAERYRERAVKSGRGIGLRSLDIVEIAESRAREAQRRMLEESIALANVIPENAATVLLDPRGETLDSNSFVKRLLLNRDSAPPLTGRLTG
jgi:23S rRNA (pseudouridine1915-N3)-methyltransferase